MKKILCFFSVLTLSLTSCSSDDNDVSSVLIRKIVETDNDGSNFIVSYTYFDGQKIKEEIGTETGYQYKATYSYDENLISSISETSDGQVISIADFTYDNEKHLRTKIVTEFGGDQKYITKTSYTHNTDGNVTYTRVNVDPETKEESNHVKGRLTFTDGNLIKEEVTSPTDQEIIVYEYDTKNNPFKNVVGVDALLDNSELGYSKHNKTKETTTSTFLSNPTIYTTTFTYDKKDFPTEAKHLDKDGKAEGSTQYFY